MSKGVKKDDKGLIIKPKDAEDFAYNLARKYQFNYRQQVGLEATINGLVSANSEEKVAALLDDLFSDIIE